MLIKVLSVLLFAVMAMARTASSSRSSNVASLSASKSYTSAMSAFSVSATTASSISSFYTSTVAISSASTSTTSELPVPSTYENPTCDNMTVLMFPTWAHPHKEGICEDNPKAYYLTVQKGVCTAFAGAGMLMPAFPVNTTWIMDTTSWNCTGIGQLWDYKAQHEKHCQDLLDVPSTYLSGIWHGC